MSLLRYIDCENTQESLLSLLKRTIVEDDDGNWYLRVFAMDTDEIPVSILTELECGEDWITLDAIVKNLLVYDNVEETWGWAVYSPEP